MKPKIVQNEWNVLNGESLIWACIGPVIRKVRQPGGNIDVAFYHSLNAGQRALFFFQILLGHSKNGSMEFFLLSDLLVREEVWTELKKGLLFFEEGELHTVLEEMQLVFGELQKANGIPDEAIAKKIKELDGRLACTLPASMERIAGRIRQSYGDYVEIV